VYFIAVYFSSCFSYLKLSDRACLPIAHWFTTIKPLCTRTLLLTVLARHLSCRQSMLWHGRSHLSWGPVFAGRRASGKQTAITRLSWEHLSDMIKLYALYHKRSMKEGSDLQHMHQIVAEALSWVPHLLSKLFPSLMLDIPFLSDLYFSFICDCIPLCREWLCFCAEADRQTAPVQPRKFSHYQICLCP